uniref:Mannosyl-oligosaccharide glucosidase n=1 Tax=Gasterosteus aculeatus aculeatus TaxID=481459 RepID=A0AAQ4QZG0_GASAC
MARRMGRQRKRVVAGEAVPLLRKDDKPPAFHRKDKKKKVDIGKVFINISIGLCIFSLAWFFYALHMRSSLAKRVVTPHPSPRVLDANSSSAAVSADRFWGSYRPQVYFGMKTRSSRSIVAGMMWMRQFADMDVNLRHTCEQGDRLQGYGWLMHDGITFGVQEIRDSDFTLTTEFVKRMGGDHGGDWTWRVTAKQHVSAGFFSAPQAPVLSLMFYTAADTQGSLEAHLEDGKRLASVTGFSKELGNFKITFRKSELLEPASRPTLPFLRRLFPRLKTWFDWYNTTQTGPLPNSYRWRGRDKDTNLFLNPKTLTSGLDDYPRASHPSADERHVDLHCWMALSSGIMASIARLLDSNKLWTPYGLRSLSRADPLYMKRNTEHDAPYWRGPIWININYLAVRALHHYSNAEGPHREKAAALYQELRTNIINNVYRQYAETGYVWEQYNDGTGRGQGSHPFTGWSALTVLMMAEQY